MALARRISLDPDLISSRANEFPVVCELLGGRVEAILKGKQRRADGAPLLLQLLERTGSSSQAMLELFSEGVAHFDSADPRGWSEWRGTLGGMTRAALLPRYSELVTALWFEACGYNICAFEPEGAPGRRADLLVSLEDEELLVETTMPGPHQDDWVDEAMDHLTLSLSRIESGLVIEVEGYESLSFEPGGRWGAVNPKVGKQQREMLVAEFAKTAERIDVSRLPQVVISPSTKQPVRITALEHHDELLKETAVMAGWSRSGLKPNVERLAEKILHERAHLPDEPASLILVDLGRWGDFRNADYYLREVARRIAGRTAPASFVGTCVSSSRNSTHGLFERSVLASDASWASTQIGSKFRSDWAGVDHTS